MKNKKNNNIGFYDKYLQEQAKEKKIEQVKEKYNISNNQKIIIEEKSLGDKIFTKIGIIVGTLVKVIFFIAIFILASIGTTVLLNSSLRNEFINLILNNLN